MEIHLDSKDQEDSILIEIDADLITALKSLWNDPLLDKLSDFKKFEELYNDAVLKVDEIAERVLTLGATPLHTFSDYLKYSSIKEAANVKDGNGTVSTTLANLKILLELEREILDLAGDAGDEGTNSQMSDYITQQEKTVWMLTAYLGN